MTGAAEHVVDVLVVGGGITGAGIALEAARRGLDVLLVEARDFAWGSSSRSSKLVHGGLRYLREGAWALTRESVRERERLLEDLPGLVDPQRFVFPHHAGRGPGRRAMGVGLAVYDALAGRRSRAYVPASQALMLAPYLEAAGLSGASSYLDACTDDARLVLRVLSEARRHGARVVNHAGVTGLLRYGQAEGPGPADVSGWAAPPIPGDVIGATLEGEGLRGRVLAGCVVSATGTWADGLRAQVGGTPMLRPLRGSHLQFPLWRLPLGASVSFPHPRDGRPVFATPWEGTALVGTTDLDHAEDPWMEPVASAAEVAYLMEALRHAFPRLAASAADATCAWAGVRPVVAAPGAPPGDPSRASREQVVKVEHRLVTVTGGKLTTFRANALDALRRAVPYLPALRRAGAPSRPRAGDFAYRREAPIFAPSPPDGDGPSGPGGAALARLAPEIRRRLVGRHGAAAVTLVAEARRGDLELVPGTPTPWAELHWAARYEQVRHLDDLLLRRTRLGLVLPEGAAALLPCLEGPVREALGWGGGEWRDECERYARLIARCYAVPTT